MEHNLEAKELEKIHVHQVYEDIAEHFSSTRYKPWPVVEDFLLSQPLGSIGADVGCGNGKYIHVNPNVYISGSDRSLNLIKIVCEKGFEGLVCDGLSLAYRSNAFDFAISIAVIHHFASAERRLEAIKEILRILRVGGTCLVFVWALEQEKNSKRKFETQDEMVSWTKKDVVYHRYYHLFKAGELDELVKDLPCEILKSGYDRDNHYVILKKK